MSPVNEGSPYTLPEVANASRYYSKCLCQFVSKRNRQRRFRKAGKTTVMKVGVPVQITTEAQYVVAQNVGVDVKIDGVKQGWKVTVDFSAAHKHTISLNSFGKTTVLSESGVVWSARPIIKLTLNNAPGGCTGIVCKHTHREMGTFMNREYNDGCTAWAAPVNANHVMILRRHAHGHFICDGCGNEFPTHKMLCSHLNVAFWHKFHRLTSSGHIDTTGGGPRTIVRQDPRWDFPINAQKVREALKKLKQPSRVRTPIFSLKPQW
jgi:hypothetical protein